jgi:hypothetical protein
MFDQLYRRAQMGRAMHVTPQNQEILENALYGVTDLMGRVRASQRANLRKRAEDLGWVSCPEIHGRHSKRPMIDCPFCRRTNASRNA